MVHVLFDNRTLERELFTVEALLGRPELARYVRWIRRRSPDRRYRARRPARRRRRK
jgi:hypothetical protein